MRRLNRRTRSAAALIFILLISVLSWASQRYPSKFAWLVEELPAGTYKVVEFADGDTIQVDMNGRAETIRFIGVDTPETQDPRKAVQCFGKAASDFTKNLIGHSPVRLEADPLSTNRDRYNRLLRYVYLPDGRLVQAEIIKEGYGFAYTSFPFTMSDEFQLYQMQARKQGKGLWGQCTPSPNQYGGFTANDAN